MGGRTGTTVCRAFPRASVGKPSGMRLALKTQGQPVALNVAEKRLALQGLAAVTMRTGPGTRPWNERN